MSSWGLSWGDSWADSWGLVSVDPGAIRGHAYGSCVVVGNLTYTQEQATGGSGKSRRVYLERDGQILLFKNAHHAAAYVAAEKAQEKPVEQPKKAPKKVQKVKPISEPIRFNIDVLATYLERYELPSDISDLIQQYEMNALLELYSKALQMEEDDLEILLLAA